MATRTIDADVVVVGAGPAGSVTAARCAQAGLRVVVVEREYADEPRVRPGETLHPGAERLLRELGVWSRVEALLPIRHEGTWVAWRRDRPLTFERFGRDETGPWHGFQIERAYLDVILLQSALGAGAQLLASEPARAPISCGGRITGIRTASYTIRARYTIDASGGRHWLARKLGANITRASPTLVASYGWASGSLPSADNGPRLVASDKGWTWLARIGEGRYAWCSLPIGGRTRGAPALRPSGLEMLACGPAAGADVTWRFAGAGAGSGYLAVGDAAFVVDPASSHGVLKAMVSGIVAAAGVQRIFERPAEEAATLAGYARFLREWFNHDVKHLNALYAAAFDSWRSDHGHRSHPQGRG